MKGVVAGVRDYGNRMGIPTVNGAVCFDPRYLGNPLVFCGTVGLIPVDRCTKAAQPGDLIVAVGGRTGRDGIHGATFSSAELTAESENGQRRGGADRQRHHREEAARRAVAGPRPRACTTPSPTAAPAASARAVGEMGEKLGARCELDQAPLKYAGPVVHRNLDLRGAGADGPGRAAGELGGACGAVRRRGRRGDGDRPLRADRPAAAARTRASRSPTWTCTSCTTAGRRWCGRRRGERRRQPPDARSGE